MNYYESFYGYDENTAVASEVLNSFQDKQREASLRDIHVITVSNMFFNEYEKSNEMFDE